MDRVDLPSNEAEEQMSLEAFEEVAYAVADAVQARDAEWLAAIDDTREDWNMRADYTLVKGFEGFFKECLKTFCYELKARMTGETEGKNDE